MDINNAQTHAVKQSKKILEKMKSIHLWYLTMTMLQNFNFHEAETHHMKITPFDTFRLRRKDVLEKEVEIALENVKCQHLVHCILQSVQPIWL